MVDLMNSGAGSFALPAAMLAVIVLGLVLWFFVHRASARANEQIALLQALLEQQKRQNALLRRLCEASEPTQPEPVKKNGPQDEDDDFIRLVAER